MESRALDNREVSVREFPDLSGSHYDPFSTNLLPLIAVTIYRSHDEQAIFSNEVLDELKVGTI